MPHAPALLLWPHASVRLFEKEEPVPSDRREREGGRGGWSRRSADSEASRAALRADARRSRDK